MERFGHSRCILFRLSSLLFFSFLFSLLLACLHVSKNWLKDLLWPELIQHLPSGQIPSSIRWPFTRCHMSSVDVTHVKCRSNTWSSYPYACSPILAKLYLLAIRKRPLSSSPTRVGKGQKLATCMACMQASYCLGFPFPFFSLCTPNLILQPWISISILLREPRL